MKIKHLKYQEIDFFKWDQSIKQSFNGVVYAYSWYLDVCCNDWEALVMGDYEYLMPLPKGGRFFVKYFYQPYLLPYLGIFTTNQLTKEIANFFIEKIPAKYKSGKLRLNQFNRIDDITSYKQEPLYTPQLDLISAYIYTYSKYNADVKDKIKTALDEKYFVNDSLSLKSFIQFYDENTNYKKQKTNYIRRLVSNCLRYRSATLFGTYNNANTLIACCLFLTSNNRTSCLLPLVAKEELDKGALHLLIDKYIKQYSSSNLVFDFYDSEQLLPTDFIEGFGTTASEYIEVERYNPLFQDMLKKYIDDPSHTE